MNKKMSGPELRTHIMEFLQEHKEGSLATCMNGKPRSSPVQYFVGNDMNIYILSAGGDKFNAIAENPDVCLLVNTEYINYRQIKGVQVFGKATTSIEAPNVFEEAMEQYVDGYQMKHEENYLKVIKVMPEEIVYLDSLKEGNRTKQILKNDDVMIKEDRMLIHH